MKLRFFVSIVLIALFMVGCSSTETTPVPEQAEVNQEAAPVEPTAALPATGEEVPSGGDVAPVSFQKDVVPLFQGYCVNCHGVERISRGLDLRTYESAMKGSQNGAMIIPGDAANSPLVKSILSGKMPKRGPIPAQTDVDLLIQWINQGAVNN